MISPAATDRAARRPVFVAGLGLSSALGADLPVAVARLDAGDLPEPVRRELVPGEVWPHRPLAAPAMGDDWYGRARTVIVEVVAVSGAVPEPGAPLFIASSSIDIGVFECGETAGPDGMHFGERVAGWLGWSGPVFWVSTACTSAINALRSAQRMIEAGAADSALVLGLEIDNRFSAAGFAGMQLLSPDRARPLAADRDGLVLGEAVAAVWLRAGDAACKKNPATPLAGAPYVPGPRWRLCGGANVVDGRDPAGASATAVAAMARQALAAAGLRAGDIDLIKLQAAGSPHNDAVEIAGLRAVFAPLPVVCSLKPLLGHTLGAAGAAELALLLAALAAGVWPPPGGDVIDPALAVTFADAAPARRRYVMTIILGFGGGHAALIFEDTQAAVA